MKKMRMTKKMFFLSIIFFVITINFIENINGLSITEIMFNPNGSDTNREWIEIKLNNSDECINLTEYKLFEEEINHNIYSYNSDITCDHAIICTDINKFLQEYNLSNESINDKNISIYRSSFTLSNSGEDIGLKKDNVFLEYINYSLILSQVSVIDGHSLEYRNDAWMQSEFVNGNPADIFDIVAVNSNNTEINNTTININESILNSTINGTNNITINNTNIDLNNTINVTTTNNISENNTGNISLETNNITIINNSSRCVVSIKLLIKNETTECDVYDNNIQIQFQNKLFFQNITESNYSIEYWIEDLKGNIIRSKTITNNQNYKSYTPNIDELDKIIIIKSSIKDINCEIINGTDEKTVIIRNINYTPKTVTCTKTESSKTESSTKTSSCSCPIIESVTDPKPIIKTINVCNSSLNSLDEMQQDKIQDKQLGQRASSATNTSQTSKSADTSMTGMIVYESPNMKNRIYAIIGLIIIGLTCIGTIVYKIYFKR